MFVLGKKSQQELVGVHPRLAAVPARAIGITTQDFMVHDGLRTQLEQAGMVASGASVTMNSRHLTGHAVDCVPFLNGKPRWEWPLIYPVAEAMRTAAISDGTPLRWGGCWDILFTDFPDISCEDLVAQYVARRRKLYPKKPVVFIDGPHFELPREFFP